jgi:peptidoglycan hydrolase-like protein with peptidoglycan-binding domain
MKRLTHSKAASSWKKNLAAGRGRGCAGRVLRRALRGSCLNGRDRRQSSARENRKNRRFTRRVSRPSRPGGAGGAVDGPYGGAPGPSGGAPGGAPEPYGAAPEPYPAAPLAAGSEYMRWVQSALNDVLGLRLPVNGIADPATRSAIRSFQQREGLPVDGVVGPDMERALLAARSGGSARAGVRMPPEPGIGQSGPAMIEPAEPAPTTPAAEFGFEWENFEQEFDMSPFEAGFEFDPEFEGIDEHMTGEADGEFESESGTKARRPTNLGEIVICGGKPFAVIDNFIFSKSTLRRDSTRNHQAQVDAIAREIVRRAARRKPVPSVCIVGHTDGAGSRDYNYGLGLQRAKTVKEALCKALGNHASSMTFVVNSMGETDPAHAGKTPAARAGNRRVDVHLLSERVRGENCASSGGGGKKLPPEGAGCGVPKTSPQREFEISEELEEWERTAPPRGARVQPRVCLYQEASNSSHRNHFHHLALGTARRIGAIGSPDAANCNPKVGATSYKTGADIINAIRAAWQCVGKKPIQIVHVFGHSFPIGIIGATAETGLYQNSYSLDASARSSGARSIADIPTDILSDNVIFVLHGCNQAYGCDIKGDDDNFAQSLLEQLSGALKNPKVYGHYNSGCAGRDNSWCMYSKKLPKGKAHSRPDYSDPGGCTPASREIDQ